MLRFVRTPDGKVEFDESGKADGRGVWIHNNESCKKTAVKRKFLNSAFKTAVPQELYDGLVE